MAFNAKSSSDVCVRDRLKIEGLLVFAQKSVMGKMK